MKLFLTVTIIVAGCASKRDAIDKQVYQAVTRVLVANEEMTLDELLYGDPKDKSSPLSPGLRKYNSELNALMVQHGLCTDDVRRIYREGQRKGW